MAILLSTFGDMVVFIVFFVACWVGFIGGGAAADDLPALSGKTYNDDVSLKVQLAETDSRHVDSSSRDSLPSSPPATAEELADLDDRNHCATPGCHGIGEPISNSCADMDLTIFTPGMVCGSPLSGPCFNHSRYDNDQSRRIAHKPPAARCICSILDEHSVSLTKYLLWFFFPRITNKHTFFFYFQPTAPSSLLCP